jgi:Lhr-like helicase
MDRVGQGREAGERDVLRKHESQHPLLRAARAEAAVGLMDVRGLADLLVGIQGRIVRRRLNRASPLALPEPRRRGEQGPVRAHRRADRRGDG